MFEAFFVTQSMQQMFFAMNYADLMHDTFTWAAEQDAITEADMLRMSARSTIVIENKGSTGRTEAVNLNEQLAMKQVKSNPLNGAKNLSMLSNNPIIMTDPRWMASDGWMKNAKHYYNI